MCIRHGLRMARMNSSSVTQAVTRWVLQAASRSSTVLRQVLSCKQQRGSAVRSTQELVLDSMCCAAALRAACALPLSLHCRVYVVSTRSQYKTNCFACVADGSCVVASIQQCHWKLLAAFVLQSSRCTAVCMPAGSSMVVGHKTRIAWVTQSHILVQ